MKTKTTLWKTTSLLVGILVFGEALATATYAAAKPTPDKVKPTIVITAPKATLTVSNQVLSLKGTAKDNVAVATVYYRLNTNAWILAQGTTNWTGQLTLNAGLNTVQAYAIDSATNSSTIASAKVTYVPTASLTVSIDGIGLGSLSGTLTTKSNVATAFAIGKAVTFTATVAKGQAFAGWTGWTNSTNATIKFTMPSTAVDLVAHFTPPPPPAGSTVYEGVVLAQTMSGISTNEAYFTASVTPSLGYSAKFTFLGGQTFSSSGKLVPVHLATNTAVANIPFKLNGHSLNASVVFSLTAPYFASGTLMEGTSLFGSFQGFRIANTNLGLYNIAIQPGSTSGNTGYGYGTVAISSTGVKLNLTLPDDNAVVTAFSTDLLEQGTIPVFAPLYGNKGFVAGWLGVDGNEINGSLIWYKPKGASAGYSPAGFLTGVSVQGGSYTPVTSLTQWGNADLVIDGDTVTDGLVDFTTSTAGATSITVNVNDGVQNFPWVITDSTGQVSFYNNTGGVTGNGLLIPMTASEPGIYGFTKSIENSVGVIHGMMATPAQ